MKKGWKVLRDDFHEHTKNVRDAVTKAPIAYLISKRLIPLSEDDDDEDECADFDQQLIERDPIIQAVRDAVPEETLENSGPRKKRPQVNGDNTILFHLSKYVYGRTSFRPPGSVTKGEWPNTHLSSSQQTWNGSISWFFHKHILKGETR